MPQLDSQEDLIIKRALEQGLLNEADLNRFGDMDTLAQLPQQTPSKWGRRIDFFILKGRLDEDTVRALAGREVYASTEPLLGKGETTVLRLPTLTVGQVFHGLLVHSQLGEGAMGAAYLASHPVLKSPLIIKTFKSSPEANLFKEAHLAARVASPYVVSVLDAGIENGLPFTVLRYVDGIDLWELTTRVMSLGRLLPTSVVTRIVIDAAQGLHTIHQAGVVHRDVKPPNLFLSGDGTTILGDFGIAVDTSASHEQPNIAGTLMFMAPEQALSSNLDRRSDIYSLGATGHYLATGKFVVEAHNLVELAKAQSHPYTPPPTDDPGKAYFFSVISRMLRHQPEDRYQTAETTARMLKVIAEPMPRYTLATSSEAVVGKIRLVLQVGDIATQEAGVIVNAANTMMLMRVGVAGALHRAGGPEIEQEAQTHAPVPMGEVVWTKAGNLRAAWVAHAVAAIDGAICLQRCTLRALLGAEARLQSSIVFPALGSGVGEVPMDLVAKLMLEAIRTFASLQLPSVRLIKIVLRDQDALTRWQTILQAM